MLSLVGSADKAKALIELRQQYPLATLLQVVKLSRSTFYDQAKAQQSVDKYADLKVRIREIYTCHNLSPVMDLFNGEWKTLVFTVVNQ